MIGRDISRRVLLVRGSATLAGLAMLRLAVPAEAFPSRPGEEVLPWWDPPAPNPVPDVIVRQLDWETLGSWRTPNDQFFVIKHYDEPAIAEQDWRLEVAGLVQRPLTLTLAELRARPRREVTVTLECSGNNGLPFFTGGVGNAAWAGTPLAPLLREAGVLERGTEVVFWGADGGTETVRDVALTEQFARSMALADATSPDHLLAYEMNGEPLPPANGFPVRLVAPGWYGVANVKWLRRIEVRDTRAEGRFMGRDYVTIREEQRDGRTVSVFTSVGRGRLKSAPAKVTRQDGAHRIVGAAWGGPIARVEVRVDDGPWMPATLDEGAGDELAWTLWSVDWAAPAAGEHTITSRAIDTAGRVQPAPTDPSLATKRTFWESNGQITRRIGIGVARPTSSPAAVPGMPGRPQRGRLAGGTGGHVAVYTFAYPGDASVYSVDLQIAPDLPEVLARAGFRVYGPVAGKEYLTGGAQPGLRPNVSGNLISRDPGDYTVQVYNDHPTLAVDYELSITRGRPEGR
jgi:DMSO/TMAO reductase YedYZ molybdopterin-dependent catalytic subunit